MNKTTEKQIEEAVEARVKTIALEQGISEVFDKVGRQDGDPEIDSLIRKEVAMIREYTKKVIKEKFGGTK